MTPEQTRALRSLRAAQWREAAHILAVVASVYGLPSDALLGRSRVALVVEARQVATVLLSTRLLWPTSHGNRSFASLRIGHLLGRHSSTVRDGIATIRRRCRHDPCLQRMLADISQMLDTSDAAPIGRQERRTAA